MKFTVTAPLQELQVAIQSLSIPVAKAATAAIKEAGDFLKVSARAHIRSAGYPAKFANAYQVTVYPKSKFSANAAAQGVLKVKYADLLATGGRIGAKKNLLWLPFPTTPRTNGRRAKANVTDFKNAHIEMISYKSKAGLPLLAAPVEMTKAQARQKIIKISLADIVTKQKRVKRRRKASANALGKAFGKRVGFTKQAMVIRNVPLFYGEPAVTMKKKFQWETVTLAVYNKLPGFYKAAIQKLASN